MLSTDIIYYVIKNLLAPLNVLRHWSLFLFSCYLILQTAILDICVGKDPCILLFNSFQESLDISYIQKVV